MYVDLSHPSIPPAWRDNPDFRARIAARTHRYCIDDGVVVLRSLRPGLPSFRLDDSPSLLRTTAVERPKPTVTPTIRPAPRELLTAPQDISPRLLGSGQYPTPFVVGFPIRYRVLTTERQGWHREYIANHAIDSALRGNIDVLIAHNRNYKVASTRDGTLTLRPHYGGIAAELSLLGHNRQLGLAVARMMQQGRLRGFSFLMERQEMELRELPSGEIIRQITWAVVTEISLTSRPAYDCTSAELRFGPHDWSMREYVPSGLISELEAL